MVQGVQQPCIGSAVLDAGFAAHHATAAVMRFASRVDKDLFNVISQFAKAVGFSSHCLQKTVYLLASFLKLAVGLCLQNVLLTGTNSVKHRV